MDACDNLRRCSASGSLYQRALRSDYSITMTVYDMQDVRSKACDHARPPLMLWHYCVPNSNKTEAVKETLAIHPVCLPFAVCHTEALAALKHTETA